MSDRWTIDPDQVVWEVLDGEAVIVDLAAGHYHAAPGVAATVWQAVASGCDLDGIVATVRAAHLDVPDDPAPAITAFLDQLVGAGLAATAPAGDGGPGAAPNAPTSPTAWQPPALESHDDLEDLLLLDPVHDVTDAGWPNAAGPTD